MPDAVAKRVQELEDKVHALQQLLLAHVLAFDQVDRLATDGTFTIAERQAIVAREKGRGAAAVRLAGLIESIKNARPELD